MPSEGETGEFGTNLLEESADAEDSQDQPNDLGFSRATVRTIKTLTSKFEETAGEEQELWYDDLTSAVSHYFGCALLC